MCLPLLVGLLLSVVGVAFVSAPVPIEELAYDDGECDGGIIRGAAQGEQLSVRFSLPLGWTTAKILQAKYYIYNDPAAFFVCIYGSDGTSELTSPFDVTPTTTGWFAVDLAGLGIIVSNDFYIAIEWKTDVYPWIGYDDDPPIDSRSYYRSPFIGPPYWTWRVLSSDFMIRAVVEQVVPPIPEFSLAIPVVTSLAATMYLAIRKRLSRKLE